MVIDLTNIQLSMVHRLCYGEDYENAVYNTADDFSVSVSEVKEEMDNLLTKLEKWYK